MVAGSLTWGLVPEHGTWGPHHSNGNTLGINYLIKLHKLTSVRDLEQYCFRNKPFGKC